MLKFPALKGEGIVEAAEQAVKLTGKRSGSSKHSFEAKVEDALKDIESIALGSVEESQKRWFAIKLFENDEKVAGEVKSFRQCS